MFEDTPCFDILSPQINHCT